MTPPPLELFRKLIRFRSAIRPLASQERPQYVVHLQKVCNERQHITKKKDNHDS